MTYGRLVAHPDNMDRTADCTAKCAVVKAAMSVHYFSDLITANLSLFRLVSACEWCCFELKRFSNGSNTSSKEWNWVRMQKKKYSFVIPDRQLRTRWTRWCSWISCSKTSSWNARRAMGNGSRNQGIRLSSVLVIEPVSNCLPDFRQAWRRSTVLIVICFDANYRILTTSINAPAWSRNMF